MAVITERGRLARARAFYDNMNNVTSKVRTVAQSGNTPKNAERHNYFLALGYDETIGDSMTEDTQADLKWNNIKYFLRVFPSDGVEVGATGAPDEPGAVSERLITDSESVRVKFCIPTEDLDGTTNAQRYVGQGRFSYNGRSWTMMNEEDVLYDNQTFTPSGGSVKQIFKEVTTNGVTERTTPHYIYIAFDADIDALANALGVNVRTLSDINQIGLVSYLNLRSGIARNVAASNNAAWAFVNNDTNVPVTTAFGGFSHGYIECYQNRTPISLKDSTNNRVTFSIIIQF